MIELLDEVKRELPDLMIDVNSWQSLYIDYHSPVVSRLWIPWRDFRLSLHKISPCSREDALFHPHPWPSAMEIIHGTYEYAVGFGSGEKIPPIAQLGVASVGSRYEMTHPDAWHYVAPIKFPAYTIMLTGKPWDRWSPSSTRQLFPLFDQDKREILDRFRHWLGYQPEYLTYFTRDQAMRHMDTNLSNYAATAHVANCQQCQDKLKNDFKKRISLPSDAD